MKCCCASLESISDQKKNMKHPTAVERQLEPELCHHIPFLHATIWCDTISHLHGKDKGNALKLLVFCNIAVVLSF